MVWIGRNVAGNRRVCKGRWLDRCGFGRWRRSRVTTNIRNNTVDLSGTRLQGALWGRKHELDGNMLLRHGRGVVCWRSIGFVWQKWVVRVWSPTHLGELGSVGTWGVGRYWRGGGKALLWHQSIATMTTVLGDGDFFLCLLSLYTVFLKAKEVLLGMAANLNRCLCFEDFLNGFPVSAVLVHSFNKAVVLLLCPVLAALGQDVLFSSP
mmetsp:Transcript_16258/g.40048  ORF Transcript_16258/g.40048 Transcript_16258/m.40048 type:complete len:208 (+) Transcript_16258:359-982(+)